MDFLAHLVHDVPHFPLTTRVITLVKILSNNPTARLLLKADGSVVNNSEGQPPISIKAIYFEMTDVLVHGEVGASRPFCRVEGLRDPHSCTFMWGSTKELLSDRLRIRRLGWCDRTFFHPEFAHLISGR